MLHFFKTFRCIGFIASAAFIVCQLKAQVKGIGPTGNQDYDSDGKDGNGTGRIYCIAFHPKYNAPGGAYNKTMYVGTPYGGLWESTDGGENWVANHAVEQLEINSVDDIQAVTDPATGKTVIYICTGNDVHAGVEGFVFPSCGIYKSTDMGKTFTPIGNFNTTYNFDYRHNKLTSKIAVSPLNASLMFVATSDGLYRTDNGGNTWTLVLPGDHPADSKTPGIWSVKFGINNPNEIYACGKYLYLSKSGGKANTFTAINKVEIDSLLDTYKKTQSVDAAFTEVNSDIDIVYSHGTDDVYWHFFYVIAYNNRTAKGDLIYYWNATEEQNRNITYDYGNSQTFFSRGMNAPDMIKIAANPFNPMLVLDGGTQTQSLLVNPGLNNQKWTNVTGYNNNGHADIHALAFVPYENSAFVGTDGGLYKVTFDTSGNVMSIKEKNHGLSISLASAVSCSNTSAPKILIGKQDTNFDVWDSAKWTHGSVSGDGYSPVLINPYNDQEFWISINGVVKEFNLKNGVWTMAFNMGACNNSNSISSILYDPYDTQKIYVPHSYGSQFGDDDLLDISTDGGKTFNRLSSYGKRGDTIAGDICHSPGCGAITKTSPVQVFIGTNSFSIWDNPHLYMFDVNNYGNAVKGCTNDAPCRGKYPCQEELEYIPPLANPHIYPFGPDKQNNNDQSNAAYQRYKYPINSIAVSDKQIKYGKKHNEVVRPSHIWVSINCADLNDLKYQIRRSDDGGISWVDDNEGLPPYPITKLLYVDGSDDDIYAATATGLLFYKHGAKEKWTPVFTDFPHSVVSDMTINYPTRQLIISTFGRGVFLADLISNQH